ncbi:MAG: hypothetical protein ACI4PH_05700 [Faecousia sp.]
MSHKEITEKQASAWLGAALAAPLAQTASGCSWSAVLLMGGACLLINWAIGKYPAEKSRWLTILQGIWNCIVISEILHWSAYCWPDPGSTYVVLLILLLLGAWAASRRERAARTGCVLLWPMLLLLGAVLLSGIPEVEWKHLMPVWQMPDACLITVALIPALYSGRGGKTSGRLLWGVAIFAVVTAMVTAGVLSLTVSGKEQAPIYELSRSLSLFGVGKRLESLIAAAMTMGYYVTVTYLLSAGGNTGGEKRSVWIMAAFSGLLLVGGVRIDSRLLALGTILFWVVLPAVSGLRKNFKKMKKGVDK